MIKLFAEPLPPGFVPADMAKGSARCPCCDQFTVLRPVVMSYVLVRALRIMELIQASGKLTKGDDMANHGRTVYCTYSQLKFWRLIEKQGEAEWIITARGIEFLAGTVQVPRQVWVFNNAVRDVELDNGGLIYIHQVNERGIRSRQEAREAAVPIVPTDV